MKRLLILCFMVLLVGNGIAGVTAEGEFQFWGGIKWNASPEEVKESYCIEEDIDLIENDEYSYLLLAPNDVYSDYMTPILGEDIVQNTSYIKLNFYGDAEKLSLAMVLVVYHADSIPFKELEELLCSGYTEYYHSQPGRRSDPDVEWFEWQPDSFDTAIVAMIDPSNDGIGVTYVYLPYFYPEKFE